MPLMSNPPHPAPKKAVRSPISPRQCVSPVDTYVVIVASTNHENPDDDMFDVEAVNIADAIGAAVVRVRDVHRIQGVMLKNVWESM